MSDWNGTSDEQVSEFTGFDQRYVKAMRAVDRARCPKCGQSLGAHAARFVREECDRLVTP